MIYQRYVRDVHLQDFLSQLGVILHKAFCYVRTHFFKDLGITRPLQVVLLYNSTSNDLKFDNSWLKREKRSLLLYFVPSNSYNLLFHNVV